MLPNAFRCLLLALVACSASVTAFAAHSVDLNVADFGATGRDIHGDTAAIQKAIDACSSQGGGRVVIPAGASFTVGTLVLKSHVELHLERGSLLEGSPTYADYTRFAPQPVSFDPGPIPMMGVLVYAEAPRTWR